MTDDIVVVTGAARGLGLAISQAFAGDGLHVAMLDRDQEALELAAQRIDGVVVPIVCDVGSPSDVSDSVETVRTKLGVPRVLVNNAGVNPIGPSADFPTDLWHQTLDVNQSGVFYCCRSFGSLMLERRRGSIINIASINAHSAWPQRLAYCATKAAVASMTEVLAVEWASAGIRVNAIGPGVIKTELVARAISEGHSKEELYLRGTPMGRLGSPDDIAQAVRFLADDERAGFITGAFLAVDGGWLANGWVPE